MNNYWNDRYKAGGNSGDGSYGDFAKHKAEIINDYIKKFGVKTISDFGCGDGNQTTLLTGFETYVGYDISSHALYLCNTKFKDNPNVNFCSLITDLPKAELSISLDVLYHILNENEYIEYLERLFLTSEKYVLAFTSDHERNKPESAHIFHRKFTDYVKKYHSNFELIETIENTLNTSAKFFLYKKI